MRKKVLFYKQSTVGHCTFTLFKDKCVTKTIVHYDLQLNLCVPGYLQHHCW